jgi:hypothetical protein
MRSYFQILPEKVHQELSIIEDPLHPNVENLLHVPSILSYHGYSYTQICRGSRSCLYRQTLGKKTIGFEVFMILIQPETTLYGKVYPERERFPKDEDFSKTAWTYWTLEQAMEKYNELETRY